MATTMTWNSTSEISIGICSNTREIAVTGIEWAEARAAGIKAVAQDNGYNPEDLTPSQYEFCEVTVLSEIDDADYWEAIMDTSTNIWYL